MFMNFKLLMAVVVVGCVTYLTVPLAGPVMWQKFKDPVELTPFSGAYVGSEHTMQTTFAMQKTAIANGVFCYNDIVWDKKLGHDVTKTVGPTVSDSKSCQALTSVKRHPGHEVGFTADYGFLERAAEKTKMAMADDRLETIRLFEEDDVTAADNGDEARNTNKDGDLLDKSNAAYDSWLPGTESKWSMLFRTNNCGWMATTQEAGTKQSRCKTAKRTHRGLVIMYFLYLLSAAFHTYAPPKVRPGLPFYVHTFFTLVSWVLLLTLVVSHVPDKYDYYGGNEISDTADAKVALSEKSVWNKTETEWVPATLAIAIIALLIQFADLAMTGWSKYTGRDYKPAMAAVYSNPMFEYASGGMQ